MAEGIAGVFYPGVWLFLLPIPYRWSYLLFLAAHSALAGWGALRFARQIGASPVAAFWAAVCYPFSGYLLFQIYNPIYLVSGAWLPFTLAALYRLLLVESADSLKHGTSEGFVGRAVTSQHVRASLLHHRWNRSVTDVIACGVFLAVMILGGDPQTAYHCCLVAGVTWLVSLLLRAKKLRSASPQHNPGDGSFLFLIGPKLLCVAGIALALAAIQVIPTANYAKKSDRAFWAAMGNPRDGTARSGTGSSFAGESRGKDEFECSYWWQKVAAAERRAYDRQIYDFSTPAYRWLEFLWPSFGGRPFPVHTRWIAGIIEEGRWWVPTLYQGLITAVLAVSAARLGLKGPFSRATSSVGGSGSQLKILRPGSVFAHHTRGQADSLELGERGRIWLTWLGLLAAIAALGWYGPAGLVGETLRRLTGWDYERAGLSPAVGGLYWLLVHCLPNYALFRYPSKWLVFTSLAVAVLAAMGVEAYRENRLSAGRLLAGLVGCVGLTTVAALVAAAVISRPELSAAVPESAIFGPFSSEIAVREIWWTVSSLIALVAAAAMIVKYLQRQWRTLALVGLMVIDLTVHNSWLVVGVRPPAIDIPTQFQQPSCQQPPRRFWQAWCSYPPQWSQRASPSRLQEICDWEFRTAAFRWGMLLNRAPLENYGTFLPADQAVLLSLLRAWLAEEKQSSPPAAWLNLLAVKPGTAGEIPTRNNPALSGELAVEWSGTDSSWVELAHQWEIVLKGTSGRQNLWEEIAHIYFSGGRPREGKRLHRVELGEGESSRQLAIPQSAPNLSDPDAAEFLDVIRYRPGNVLVHVRLNSPGLVILREGIDPGWAIVVKSSDGKRVRVQPALRVDGIFTSAFLMPGDWLVEFKYSPPGLPWGAGISIVGWANLVGFLLWQGILKRTAIRSPRTSDSHRHAPSTSGKAPEERFYAAS